MHPKFEVRGLPAAREHGRRQADTAPAASTPFQLDGKMTVTQVRVVFATGNPPPPAPAVTPSPSSASAVPSSSSSSVAAASTPSDSPIVSPTPSPSAVVAVPSPTPSFVTGSDTQNPSSPSGNLSGDGKPPGLSSGAIAGVVTALLLVALGVLVFFVRKRFISQRQKKRGTWVASFKPGEKGISNLTPVPAAPPPPMASAKAKATFDVSAYAQPISPPATSYNNAPTPGLINEPIIGAAAPTVPTASAAMAVIRCTFIPSMPDELNITNGEVVRVLGEYDDGWALVANARGEQGMVPLECLARGSRASLLEGDRETLYAPDVLRKRETQRLSSLSGISGISQRR